jgi:hypothetical protein
MGAPGGSKIRDGRAGAAAVGIMAALGVVHALTVAVRYHVGSFDDDASYVLAARAVAAGHGLASRMAGGDPLVGVYPPGYPALLSPLAAIWPNRVEPFRVVSLLLFVAIFPLSWKYLERRNLPESSRLAVLALLALNPALATYATMVMPEVAFVVLLLLMLLAVDRWQSEAATISWAGMATVSCAAALPWFKEAGVGIVVGLVVWLASQRRWRKAVIAAGVPGVLFLVLLGVRALAGANLVGSRYSRDLGGAFEGGLVTRAVHLAPRAAWSYFSQAIPRSIVPTRNGFLPDHGPIGVLLLVLTWTAAPLVGVGLVVWLRRYRDCGCVVVIVYLVETLLYPFTNERRVILVLPVFLAWYVVGATWVFATVRRAAVRRAADRRAAGEVSGRLAPRLAAGLPIVAVLLVAGSLSSQFTRDYLYFEGASSSSPGASPYMALLQRLGEPRDVIETDYLWTTALYTRHRTANGANLARCDSQAVADAIRADHAAYLLTASLNGGGEVDDACLLPAVAGLPSAVRVYRSDKDQASVFELVGPGTGNPALRDLTALAIQDGGSHPVAAAAEAPQAVGDPGGQYSTTMAADGPATLTWTWPQPILVSQISVGAAGALDGGTTSVTASGRGGDGRWQTLAAAAGPVGPGTQNPFLLVAGTRAALTAVRVTIGVKRPGTVAVHDFHVLGPIPNVTENTGR